MKKRFGIAIIFFGLFLCGCSAENIAINRNSSTEETSADVTTQSEVKDTNLSTTAAMESSTPSSESSQTEKNIRPKLGETFDCSHFAANGTLYVTVNSANYYENIYDADIDLQNFDDEILNAAAQFDANTGEIYQIDGAEYIFVLVHMTVENIDAVSNYTDFTSFFQGLEPELYTDGYCTDYDFYAGNFGIVTDKAPGAEDTANLASTGVDYFSLKGQTYSDYYREFLYRLEPEETIEFDIGRFVCASISDESIAQAYGGEIGDDLISRYILNTSSSLIYPYVELGLKRR